jgi:hypothetical protein
MPPREITIPYFLQELGNVLRSGFEAAKVHEYLPSTLIEPISLEPYVTLRPTASRATLLSPPRSQVWNSR